MPIKDRNLKYFAEWEQFPPLLPLRMLNIWIAIYHLIAKVLLIDRPQDVKKKDVSLSIILSCHWYTGHPVGRHLKFCDR